MALLCEKTEVGFTLIAERILQYCSCMTEQHCSDWRYRSPCEAKGSSFSLEPLWKRPFFQVSPPSLSLADP